MFELIYSNKTRFDHVTVQEGMICYLQIKNNLRFNQDDKLCASFLK